MSCMLKHHQELTDGTGKCSVPMWRLGTPAGFCDEPAYGHQPPTEALPWWLDLPYAPGLACPAHGGPPPQMSAEDKR